MLLGRDSRLNEALDSFDEAERLSLSNPEGRIEAIYQRGALMNALRRYADAATEHERALGLAVEFQQRDQQIRVLTQLSVAKRNLREFEEAERYIQEALNLSTGRPQLRANALIDLGYFYQATTEFAQAEEYFRQGLEAADVVSARRTQARAQGALAALLRGRDNNEVLQFAQKAFDFYGQGGYRRQTVQAMGLIGFVHSMRGHFDLAESTLQEQQEIARRFGDDALIASAAVGFGEALSRQGQLAPALAVVTTARSLYEQLGLMRSLTFAKRDEAALLAQLGQAEDAILILESLADD